MVKSLTTIKDYNAIKGLLKSWEVTLLGKNYLKSPK